MHSLKLRNESWVFTVTLYQMNKSELLQKVVEHLPPLFRIPLLDAPDLM